MAHEIEEGKDNVVLRNTGAWHGLGKIFTGDMSPVEALPEFGGDWEVDQWDLIAVCRKTGRLRTVDTHVLNVRHDTDDQLSVVGVDWNVIQNRTTAEFAGALAKDGDTVKIETAGTIRGGKKIWFLLRGESFTVRNEMDRVIPYILVSNGHDGKTGLRATPTTIRVVCSNTLHMVVPDGLNSRRFVECGFSCTHVGDVMTKIEDARKALKLYEYARKEQITLYNELAGKGVNSEMIKQFFVECYTRMIGKVPMNPQTEKESKAKTRAMEFIGKCLYNFDAESSRFGANVWTMVNAFTETSQKQRKSQSARESSLLFGVDAQRGVKAVKLALALAV